MRVELVDICTCGHSILDHIGPAGTAVSCDVERCRCKRYDRRNFNDAELELLRLGELDRMRALHAAAAAPVDPPAPAPASPDALERIAGALERIAAELEVLTRPARYAHPCPKLGVHTFVEGDTGGMTCTKCGIGFP